MNSNRASLNSAKRGSISTPTPNQHKTNSNGIMAFPISVSIFLLSSLLFFFIFPPSSPISPNSHRRTLLLLNDTATPPPPSCSSIHLLPAADRCPLSLLHCESDSPGLINYFSLHFCLFHGSLLYSLPFLSLSILFFFYALVKTAQDRFSVVVTKLCSRLSLSPSMAAVTLLALGNGAPDVFASLAAVRAGHPRTGFGAILSAGAFVSAFVVGFVAINAAPFSVDPASFIRDVMFYLTAALFLFYVYLSGELYLWQAVGFVGFYLFFVGLVFWMDLGDRKDGGESKFGGVGFGEGDFRESLVLSDCESGDLKLESEEGKRNLGFRQYFGKISKIWEVPVSLLLKLTVPQTSPSEWSRFYCSANIALCPVALLYSCNSFIPLSHPVTFLFSSNHLPLWSVVLFSCSCLALLHYAVEKDPPKSEQVPVVLIAFVMSVFWISNVAGELLNCLAALGTLLELPPTLLGLTVLAWGNSVGDLVADVALAKAGQPTLAMAGCFAGPMFNMLCGLGMALVIQTADVYPEAYTLRFHISIVVAFVFLILSLMGSLLVVTWCRFRVPRFWGFCLVGLYVFFMAVSLLIAQFTS